ncbi:Phage protein [Mycolicibacterium fortuitum]|uniref:Phage protein n=1 Tax=Mycolicibacterium fortuitum TaxID=1766 RepID=A0A0N7H993_MYCFO|nr:Gp19/Gp15/Gp42 family protein [Mycolicibacterium fortuitum]ALI28383.1 Phage protein [Mycolicibacterium fortuitum]
MTYAVANDVAARLGRSLTADETTQVAALLGDAEIDIRERIPDLDTRAEDEDYLAKVIRVEASAVARLVRNPDGYTAEGDGNYNYQINWRLSTGQLEITEKEWQLLGVSSGVAALDVRARTPFERAQAAAEAAGVHPFMLGWGADPFGGVW